MLWLSAVTLLSLQNLSFHERSCMMSSRMGKSQHLLHGGGHTSMDIFFSTGTLINLSVTDFKAYQITLQLFFNEEAKLIGIGPADRIYRTYFLLEQQWGARVLTMTLTWGNWLPDLGWGLVQVQTVRLSHLSTHYIQWRSRAWFSCPL